MVREKLKILYNSMEWVGFSTSQPWRAYNVKFNKYFNYPEKDIRWNTSCFLWYVAAVDR